MCTEHRRAGKYISIIDRLSRIFYAHHYAGLRIGSGQQYFLSWIYERPGTTAGQLAQYGQYDKGTTAKAVQKLEEWGYIRVELDSHDQRIRRLYALPAADETIREVYAARADFEEVLTHGFTEAECLMFEELLRRAAENVRQNVSSEQSANVPCATSAPPASEESVDAPDLP